MKPIRVVIALALLELVPGSLPAQTTGERKTQGPAPVYVKCATWAETLTALREQAAGQLELFRPQRVSRPRSPAFFQVPGQSQAPPHPLVSLWARLEQDFPLECDWMLQDLAACGYPSSNPLQNDHYPIRWFGPQADMDLEKTLLVHVVEELRAEGEKTRSELEKLRQVGTPAHSRPWLELYAKACQTRRDKRLRILAARCPAFVFTKHFNMGGSHYSFTEGLSDAQSERHFVPGSALCLLEMKGTTPVVRTLLEDRTGVIRDPDVSYEGDRILFAWKKSDRLDDYHLHEMDLTSGKVRQLTSGLGFADYEGAYLPGGDLVLNSTRCVQAVDCFFTEVSNFYTCDRNGRFLRRLGFDQVHTNYPTVTEDGRVLYTRWEYNDRGQVFTQPLFQMNPDGTGQTEYYGNNSYFPTSLLHARQIPGTSKVLAIAAGHHTQQMGKLIVLDPSLGRQEAAGAHLVAPVRKTPAVREDTYGQEGELWQYPYPLSETDYLVTYNPWGSGRQPLLFAVYFMTIDGRRELLAHDPQVSCNQPVPLHRPVPHRRPRATDYGRETGTFYVQDVYAGSGLAGVPRGKAKKLRVIALDFRPTVVGGNHNSGEAGMGFVATPVAVAQGSWEAKTVLGETPICADGSAFFTAPARTPLFFQVVDDQGYVIQTMRSWSTLQPGENASCVGCHEPKSSTPLAGQVRQAERQGPRPLEPFYGSPRGFSFPREIQPILDRHCVGCHDNRSTLPWVTGPLIPNTGPAKENGKETAFSLLSTTTVDPTARRRFSDAYLALTGAVWGYDRSLEGRSRPLVNWISPQSGPPMRKPYSAGSATSRLMKLLEDGHREVKLSREEREKLACWIDLVVPYCGDYREANAWFPFESARYDYFLSKRKKMEAVEARNRHEMVAAPMGKGESAGMEDKRDSGVTLMAEVLASDDSVLLRRQAQASPHLPMVMEIPRPLRSGDRIRVQGARHLAVQFDQNWGESLVHVPDEHLEWTVPAEVGQAESGKSPYPPGTYLRQRSRLSFRPVALAELDQYRNVAANPNDLRGAVSFFPHASAGSECRNDPVYAARNAIDGQRQNTRHGSWPYESWSPEQVDKSWWQVDFGLEVEIDKVVIVLRADFPHDGCWHRTTLVFSDGHRQTIDLEKSAGPQTFTFPPRKTSSLRLADLVQDEPRGWCGLAEVEAWGRDRIPVAQDLAATAP